MRQLFQPIAALVYVIARRQQAVAADVRQKFPRASRSLRNWTRCELRPWAEFS